ncbi:MAG: FAD-binding protein, partial [Pseudomonadota bacterium]|nr:FAD-binding protein [Pseudomonadota bacterium]
SIKVFTETKAVDILRDINGNIIGVLAQNKNSGMKYYKTKAVIIGTGTNTHNFEFIMRYNPETIKRETIHGPWGTGDGIIMAEKLNAKFEGFGETIFGKTAGDGVALFEGTREVEQLVAYHDWVKKDKRAFIYVNENGNRYADETLGYQGATGLEIRNQPSGVGICILDQTLYADPGYFAFSVAGTKEKLDDAVKTGLIKKAHSLEKLASLLEINDIDVFINTVAIYNRYAERGEDLEFGRAVETLRPITQPPFYGYRVRSSGRDAKIFISVNENCQVLDRDGWVIPGLYATGDTISYATRGHGYPGSGVSLASGFAAGRIAGQHATLSLTKNLRS